MRQSGSGIDELSTERPSSTKNHAITDAQMQSGQKMRRGQLCRDKPRSTRLRKIPVMGMRRVGRTPRRGISAASHGAFGAPCRVRRATRRNRCRDEWIRPQSLSRSRFAGAFHFRARRAAATKISRDRNRLSHGACWQRWPGSRNRIAAIAAAAE